LGFSTASLDVKRESMNITLRIIGLVGFLLFGASFIFTYSMPDFVEEVGKDFIKGKIQEQTQQKIHSLKLNHQNSILSKFASKLAKNNEREISRLKESLKIKTNAKLVAVIAEMRDLDCECRKKYEEALNNQTESQVVSLESADKKIIAFMKMKYMEVANKLKADLRIFTGSNAIVFAILLLFSLLKPKAITHLFLPGILLVTSTVICSYFYIFEQNWFFTIIYNSYLGWGYLGYIGIVFAFLCDIAFNKARITTELINGILKGLGSTLSVVQC